MFGCNTRSHTNSLNGESLLYPSLVTQNFVKTDPNLVQEEGGFRCPPGTTISVFMSSRTQER